MSGERPLRVLFLHATWHDSSEYKVHRLLAEHASPELVESYFIWQHANYEGAHTRLPRLPRSDLVMTHDFGRDMSIVPRPKRRQRALMMLKNLPTAFRLLSQKIGDVRPDVIYTSQQYYEVALASKLSLLFDIPHLIHISYPVGPWLGKNTLRTILDTPHLIACSDYVRNTAIAAGVSPNRIETLLHGADLSAYDIEGDPEGMRSSFGWPADAPVVIAAGRLDPGKGIDVLLDAFAIVSQAVPGARLIVCGEGTTGSGFAQSLKQKAHSLGLDAVVNFAGFRRDLPQLLAASDVFCLPTEHDALPLVFLNAMAAGLPVIGVRSGGVPEMVFHQQNGLLADPGDADAIAHHLIALLTNKALARHPGKRGRTWAVERHNPRAVASRWTALLYQYLREPVRVGNGLPLRGEEAAAS